MDISFANNNVFKLIDDYYNHPVLCKVKDDNNYSIYMAEIKNMLSNTYRYIVAVVEQDLFFINSERNLKYLNWISFQVRTFPNKQPGVTATVNTNLANRNSPTGKIEISKVSKNTLTTIYECIQIVSLKVILLNDEKNFYDYPQRGTLQSALETYNTLLEFSI